MPEAHIYHKDMIDVECVDCGNVYKKNKYTARKAAEQVCNPCRIKRMNKARTGEIILAGARRVK